MTAGFSDFLAELRASRNYAGQIVYCEHLPARPARYAEPSRPLSPPLIEVLGRAGIERLYCHQAEALDHLRAGEHVVVVTSTASGKTLCYNLPVLEALLEDSQARALQTSAIQNMIRKPYLVLIPLMP